MGLKRTKIRNLCGEPLAVFFAAIIISSSIVSASFSDESPEAECDRLAADPYDPNSSQVEGQVTLNDRDAGGAVASCRSAMERNSDNLRYMYQFARAAWEYGWRRDLATGEHVYDTELRQEAQEVARSAAEAGYPPAQYLLGQMLHYRGEYAEAIREFEKAAERGFARAQYSLALTYEFGSGVPQDFSQAIRWHTAAAEQGLPEAQYELGKMYEEARGVERDLVTAHMWYNLAASRYFLQQSSNTEAARARERVAEHMTVPQVAEAQRRAREWERENSQN